MIEAKEYIDSGKLGKIHMCRVYDQKRWGNVSAVPDGPAPAHLDWNMWNGPAPQASYNFNYWENWNHLWRYSGGDIINDSIHQIDLARWLTERTIPIAFTRSAAAGPKRAFTKPPTLRSPSTSLTTW